MPLLDQLSLLECHAQIHVPKVNKPPNNQSWMPKETTKIKLENL